MISPYFWSTEFLEDFIRGLFVLLNFLWTVKRSKLSKDEQIEATSVESFGRESSVKIL